MIGKRILVILVLVTMPFSSISTAIARETYTCLPQNNQLLPPVFGIAGTLSLPSRLINRMLADEDTPLSPRMKASRADTRDPATVPPPCMLSSQYHKPVKDDITPSSGLPGDGLAAAAYGLRVRPPGQSPLNTGPLIILLFMMFFVVLRRSNLPWAFTSLLSRSPEPDLQLKSGFSLSAVPLC